jgi:hypothetical protein
MPCQIISSSPGDLPPVFETMLTNATRICAAKFGVLWLSEGERFRCVALHNAPPAFADHYRDEPMVNPPPGSGLRRLFETRQVTQVTDLSQTARYAAGESATVAAAFPASNRSIPLRFEQFSFFISFPITKCLPCGSAAAVFPRASPGAMAETPPTERSPRPHRSSRLPLGQAH